MTAPSSLVDLRELSQDKLIRFVEQLGQPAFRGKQLLPWLYKPGPASFSAMSDLAKDFRALLARQAYISSLAPVAVARSRDGAVKFVFALEDGHAIESVLIPEEDRNTLCISSQAGCAMGCSFCFTGKMGFGRNLRVAEIVGQVCAVRDWMREHQLPPLTNLVFMGMGEPLANLDRVLDAISLFTEQRGLDFSNRRITVSTCGLVPQMLRLGEESEVNLAISLHAADDATRSRLMPVNRRYPLAELIDAARRYRQKRRKRVMFEYTLLAGINDSDADAERLTRLLRGIRCKINLLGVNPVADSDFRSPGTERILHFQSILRAQGYTVFIRQSRGSDIAAACGQLAGKTALRSDAAGADAAA